MLWRNLLTLVSPTASDLITIRVGHTAASTSGFKDWILSEQQINKHHVTSEFNFTGRRSESVRQRSY